MDCIKMGPTCRLALFACPLLILALVLVPTGGNGGGGDDAAQVMLLQVQPQQPAKRSRIQVPNALNFKSFKSAFNKSYRSILDELVRQKIFLGRAFKAFVSVVNYLHFRLTHFLSVGPQSDQTAEERRRDRVEVEWMLEQRDERGRILAEASPMANGSSVEFEEELPVAELEDIERELEDIERHEREPGYRELASELRQSSSVSRRRRRDTSERRRSRVSVDDLVRPLSADGESFETRQKIRTRVASNNPEYEQLELSSSSAVPADEHGESEPINEGVRAKISKMPGASFIKSVVNKAVNATSRTNNEAPQLPDVVYSDLRDKNCFFQVRKQTGCGACYAFTAVALFEFLHCKFTGELVAFSEQYLIDCGNRLDMKGCQGGRLSLAARFVLDFGLELRHNYPYRAAADTCPYDKSTPPTHMGYLRPSNPKFGALPLANFDDYLRLKPIMFGLRLTGDFYDYGGGVDEGDGCGGEGHAMLIVGHGREDGLEYYLFRNSHGPQWGEQGYYKFSKAALARCAVSDFGVVTLAKFDKAEKKRLNGLYRAEEVKRRQEAYRRREGDLSEA